MNGTSAPSVFGTDVIGVFLIPLSP
jgi:hypothetical protein